MTSKAGRRELVHDLRDTLDAIAEGLVDGQPDRLLAAEPTLAAARRTRSRIPHDIPTIAPHVRTCWPRVTPCDAARRSARTLSMLGEVYATRQGYTRSGHFPTAEAPGVLEARV